MRPLVSWQGPNVRSKPVFVLFSEESYDIYPSLHFISNQMLFCLYFSVFSCITPPINLDKYIHHHLIFNL
jgi:hypothetical protein